jgi:hypothetical protein
MNDELLALVETEILDWPGVRKETRGTDVTPGIDVTIYWLGRRQLGHIHHDGVADLQFPRAVHDELIASGRAAPHRGGFPAVVSYDLRQPEDVAGAVALFRLNFDRMKDKGSAAASDDARRAQRRSAD